MFGVNKLLLADGFFLREGSVALNVEFSFVELGLGLGELGAQGFDLVPVASGGRMGHRRPPCLGGIDAPVFSGRGGLRVYAGS